MSAAVEHAGLGPDEVAALLRLLATLDACGVADLGCGDADRADGVVGVVFGQLVGGRVDAFVQRGALIAGQAPGFGDDAADLAE